MKRHTSTKRSVPSRQLRHPRNKPRTERFTLAELLEARTLFSSTFVVTNTADHGAGSLRQAIMSANTGGDSSNLITFNIAGSGPQVISLLTALPAVSATVTIDATTQPGYGGTPMIELDGSMLGGADFGLPGLELDGSGDIVRGLNIYHFYDGIDVNGPRANMVGFHGSHVQILDNFIGGTPHPAEFDFANQNNGITVDSGSIGTNLAAGVVIRGNVIYGNNGYGVALANVNGATIAGNMIGLDPTGMLRMSNTADGINLIGCSHVMIGGAAASDSNVISANNGNGIYLEDSSSNSILGNLIGTDISGRLFTDSTGELFGNDGSGIRMVGSNTNSSGNLIAGNVIAGSGNAGIYIDTYVDGSPLNVIRDNMIGTDAMGDALGNVDGVWVVDGSAIIGQQGHGNVIADNHHSGVAIEFGVQVAIRANSIFSNGDLGIDLGDDGVTPNGSASMFFANNGQVFPVLTSVTRAGSLMTVNGMLTCAPGIYTVDFFSNDVADPSGYGEGKTYLGCTTVTVGASGSATFMVMFAGVTSDQTFASATATDTLGNTSEFSQDAAIVPVAMPTTTLLSSMDSTVFGQPVTFTATVSAASGTPGGSVVFMDGSTVLGSAMLDANGMATLTVSSLSVGDHSITASYSGDADDQASVSAALTQHVLMSHTATMLSSSMSSSTYGQAITFTAAVSITDAGAGMMGGMVTFMDGSTVLGTVALDSSGMASLTVSSLAVGGHSITATYSGDANFTSSSSNAVSVNVDLIPTTTMLVSSMASSFFGQSVTFTATVSAASGAVPGGSVVFMDGSNVLGSATLDASGMATLTVSSLSVASHSISASYGGSATDAASSGSFMQVVKQNTTATMLSSSAASITYGQSVTITAAVSLTSAGAGMPGGNVVFMDGSMVLGTVALNGSGMAMLTMSNLGVGGHMITATYVGDTNDMGSSSAALSMNVSQRATTTTLASSANPATFGQNVTFTATVANGGAGGLAGSVVFMDGSTVLATVSLNSSGSASFTLSTLAAGSHTITATYSGDANDSGSSASMSQVVNPPVPSAVASISGHVYTDRTGNRLSADDTALGGVTIVLFRDRNNDGVLDLFDGLPVATTVSSSTGAYSFSNVAAGRYFVLEITPFGYVQTAPTKPGYYTATISAANNSVSGLDFDNFRLLPKGHDDPHGHDHDHDGDRR
jgi:hypothetical protein